MTSDEQLYFNGVNASRGVYPREPMTVEQLAGLISGEGPGAKALEPDDDQRAELKLRLQQAQGSDFQLKEGVKETDLAQTGWAVIFPAGQHYAAVREALTPLLTLRYSQAGARYRECYGDTGYQPGETKAQFLRRVGTATNGPVDPDKFPYYVLIVGSPQEIPFRFQYQLDVQYAVGRLHFDTVAEYASYAGSVVAAESGGLRLPRRAVFFGVQNADDRATQRSSAELVQPLAAQIQADPRVGGWSLDSVIGEQATKDRLARILGGAETPAMLFTASHGIEFDDVDKRQVRHQGAVLCADWPGPKQWAHRAIPEKFYLSGDDIGADARLLGTMMFQFACFGAGTPQFDDFPHQKGTQSAITPYPFVAGLPKRLLGHPAGGALAVIGHVERAWTYSFSDGAGGRQIEIFSSAMRTLMLAGAPVGFALEYFNTRYAELASDLTQDLENLRWEPGKVNLRELTARWTEHNDARSYVVLGDPATRLPLAGDGPPAEPRPRVDELRLSGAPPAPATAAPSPAQPAAQPAPEAPAATQPAPQAPPAPPATRPAPQQPGAPPAGNVHYPPVGQPGQPFAGQPAYPPGAIIIYNGYPPPAQPGAPAQPSYGGTGGDESFGLFGSGGAASETVQKLTQALRDFSDSLGQTLQKALSDLTHLEVKTYVADDPDQLKGDLSGAQLRAVTRMSLDGDTEVVVPMSDYDLDERLWKIHLDAVQQAQANRAEMIRAMASAAAGLFNAIQGK